MADIPATQVNKTDVGFLANVKRSSFLYLI